MNAVRERRKQAILARGGQVIEVPSRNPVGRLYDQLDQLLGQDRNNSYGDHTVTGALEGFTGADTIWSETSRAIRGKAVAGDYPDLALNVVLSAPGIGLIGKGVKAAAPAVKTGIRNARSMLPTVPGLPAVRKVIDYAKGAKHYELVDGKLVPQPLYDVDELPGGIKRVRRADTGAPRIVRNPRAETAENIEELRGILADPEQNIPAQVADKYTRERFGHGYDTGVPAPKTSLEKQAGIGRVFNLAESGDPAYKRAIFERYGETMPELVEGAGARNYDQLNEAAYRSLNKEVRDQFDRLPVQLTYHNGGEE